MEHEWQRSALCYTDDNFPRAQLYEDTAVRRRKARDACLGCPVRASCLRQALENRELWGVWGGVDQDEIRRALSVDANGTRIKRTRPPHCPMCHARPQALYVSSYCSTTDRRRTDTVVCSACDFYWTSLTSVRAIRAYHRERAARRRLLVARVPQRVTQTLPVVSRAPYGVTPLEEGYGLVASAGS